MDINFVYLNPIAERVLKSIDPEECADPRVESFLLRHLNEARIPNDMEIVFLAPILIKEMEDLLDKAALSHTGSSADISALEYIAYHSLALRLFQLILFRHFSQNGIDNPFYKKL